MAEKTKIKTKKGFIFDPSKGYVPLKKDNTKVNKLTKKPKKKIEPKK